MDMDMERDRKLNEQRIRTLLGIASVLFAGTVKSTNGLEQAALAVQSVAIRLCEDMNIDWLDEVEKSGTPTQDELYAFACPAFR